MGPPGDLDRVAGIETGAAMSWPDYLGKLFWMACRVARCSTFS